MRNASQVSTRRCLLLVGMKKFEYEGRKWHAECFQCDECHQPIRDQKFAPSDDRVICVHCYEEAYAPRCHNCKGVSLFVCLHISKAHELTDHLCKMTKLLTPKNIQSWKDAKPGFRGVIYSIRSMGGGHRS